MARQFTFRFETLLKIRRQREDEHKRIVAARLREIGQVRRRIDSLDDQIRQTEEAIRTGQESGAIDLQQALRHRHWLGYLHRGRIDAEGHLRGLEARLAQERVGLAEASKQRKILDKLKDRQWYQYREELERIETKEADEMATLRYAFDRRVHRRDAEVKIVSGQK